jgi:hypothetical protein
MPQCAGIKREGGRCAVVVGESRTYCYQHDPANAEQRKRAASRGGKSKPNRELADIKHRLSDLADAVLDGTQNRGSAAVAGQLLNGVIRAVGVELKVREQLVLVERMEELESLLERWKERGGYGRT